MVVKTIISYGAFALVAYGGGLCHDQSFPCLKSGNVMARVAMNGCGF